jgi:hypothetical protein
MRTGIADRFRPALGLQSIGTVMLPGATMVTEDTLARILTQGTSLCAEDGCASREQPSR